MIIGSIIEKVTIPVLHSRQVSRYCIKLHFTFRVSFLSSGTCLDMKHIIANCLIGDFGFVYPLQCCII